MSTNLFGKQLEDVREEDEFVNEYEKCVNERPKISLCGRKRMILTVVTHFQLQKQGKGKKIWWTILHWFRKFSNIEITYA